MQPNRPASLASVTAFQVANASTVSWSHSSRVANSRSSSISDVETASWNQSR